MNRSFCRLSSSSPASSSSLRHHSAVSMLPISFISLPSVIASPLLNPLCMVCINPNSTHPTHPPFPILVSPYSRAHPIFDETAMVQKPEGCGRVWSRPRPARLLSPSSARSTRPGAWERRLLNDRRARRCSSVQPTHVAWPNNPGRRAPRPPTLLHGCTIDVDIDDDDERTNERTKDIFTLPHTHTHENITNGAYHKHDSGETNSYPEWWVLLLNDADNDEAALHISAASIMRRW